MFCGCFLSEEAGFLISLDKVENTLINAPMMFCVINN